MASAHLVVANQGIGGQKQPAVPAEYFGSNIGQGAEEVATVFQKIQQAADDSQAGAIHVTGEHALDSALLTTAQNSPTADDFNKNIQPALKAAYDDALAPASNNRVKSLASNKLALSYANHQTKAKEIYWKKKVGETQANDLIVGDSLKNDAIAGDQATTNAKFVEYRDLMMERGRQGVYTPQEATKNILKFQHDVIGDKLALAAKDEPLTFYDRVKSGEFTGATAVQIKDSLEIADRELHQREVRNAQVGKQRSEQAEREFEQQAANRTLDINELRRQAHIYGWDDKKVNGLINMQIGLNLANPYEEKLIEDAAESIYRSIRPSMGEIAEANQRIEKLVKEKLISNQTTAYKSMKTRLQSMARDWRIQGEMQGLRAESQETKAESAARRDLNDIFNVYYPGGLPDRVKAEKNKHFRALEGMAPNEQRAYVKDIETKMMRAFEDNKPGAVRAGELRGTMGNKK